MLWLADHWMILLGNGIAALVAGYALVECLAVILWQWRRRTRRRRPDATLHPVTLLKPLCGAEPGLYESLRTCCEQDYPDFQIVFGVRHLADPAVGVVRQLQEAFPDRDLSLVVDDQLSGTNYKVSNLINMLPAARHEWIVISDSDIRVGRDYLATVAPDLDDPDVGIVTCLYRARPGSHIAARLSAMLINGWFMPSVLVSRLGGWHAFGFGATLAMRRHVLEEIGGLRAVADHVADDYMLSARVRGLGYETRLCDYLVETTTADSTLAALWSHELRQARALRVVQPVGYAFMAITFAVPLCLAMVVLAAFNPVAVGLLGLTIASRWAVEIIVGPSRRRALVDGWLVPVRDCLSLAVWFWNYAGNRIVWRGRYFRIGGGGVLSEVQPLNRRALKPASVAAWFRLRHAISRYL